MKTIKSSKASICLLFFLLVTLVPPPVRAQETARQIIEKTEQQMRGETMYSELTMTTVRPRYTRDVTMKTWSKGEDFSLILITAPARDKGTAFLKRQKEIWNYVPNIDRMIKMPPSMMSQSWMGSDFSNDDLVRESSTISDYRHSILREEVCEGRSCWVLELIPKPESSIVYEKVLVWIDKQHYIQLKIENYDEDGSLVSTLLFSEVKLMGGRTMPTLMEMIPADKPNQKTVIRYTDARFNAPIEESFFSVQNLKNIR
jgi:outer membrane lipoprotein-sorting protein